MDIINVAIKIVVSCLIPFLSSFFFVCPCRKFHEPLPVVPLKVLAHNELVGRVIGKERERGGRGRERKRRREKEREREREGEDLNSFIYVSLFIRSNSSSIESTCLSPSFACSSSWIKRHSSPHLDHEVDS